MSYIANFFNHAKSMQAAAVALGMKASMQFSDFSLRLEGNGRSATWRPKFVASMSGRLMYTGAMSPDMIGFAGWMPYAIRQWPIAVDKAAFKRFAIEADIPTPMACFDPALIGGPFIIKQHNSSFGEGIRGPFLGYDSSDPAQQLARNEYYENFILGVSAKAWCWGSQCVAVHLEKPTIVVGDGASTLKDLVLALPNSRGENDWELIRSLGRYSGIGSEGDIVPAGKEVVVEYRHGSRYRKTKKSNANVLDQIRETELGSQFRRASTVFAGGISTDAQLQESLYSLDAVVDAQGNAWFLEMNCNPLVHPDSYGAMLGSRFAQGAEQVIFEDTV